jgi:hypothetical protein
VATVNCIYAVVLSSVGRIYFHHRAIPGAIAIDGAMGSGADVLNRHDLWSVVYGAAVCVDLRRGMEG